MRFSDYTILELALAIRDSKANPNSYDREARETLRRACRQQVSQQTLEVVLARFEHQADRTLAKEAYLEVTVYSKPVGYTSGVWA